MQKEEMELNTMIPSNVLAGIEEMLADVAQLSETMTAVTWAIQSAPDLTTLREIERLETEH